MFLLLSIRTTAETLGLLNISSCANFAMNEQTVFVSSQQTPSNLAFSSSSSPCARTKYINKIIKTTILFTMSFSNYLLLLCSKLCKKIAVRNFPIKINPSQISYPAPLRRFRKVSHSASVLKMVYVSSTYRK